MLWIGGALWVAAAAWFVIPTDPGSVERLFSLGWYRTLLELLAPGIEVLPFPVVFVLFAAILGAAAFCLLRFGARSFRSATLRIVRFLLIAIPLGVIWFVVCWGAGYRRLPVETRLELDSSAITQEESSRLRSALLEIVQRSSISVAQRDPLNAIASVSQSMTLIVSKWDGRPLRLPSRVKRVPAGVLLASGTAGMCSPFTLEPLVDGGLPATAFVSTAAHELGHIAGFCGEGEATFIGYLAGLRALDPYARYACGLEAYRDLIGSLPTPEFERAYAALPAVARRDLEETREAYGRYRTPWLSRLAFRWYDRYLKAQGVDEGVLSYSHGIELLSFAWRQRIAFSSDYRDYRPSDCRAYRMIRPRWDRITGSGHIGDLSLEPSSNGH